MPLPDPSVLIVVGDILLRDLIFMAVKRGGLNPQICKDLADLPDLLEKKKPPILLVDIYLPGSNGLDLVVDLSDRGLLEHTKVIGISSMAFPEVVHKLAQAGFADILVKPLDTDLLVERIKRVIR